MWNIKGLQEERDSEVMKVSSGFFEQGGSLCYFLHTLSLQTGLLDLNDHSILNTDILSDAGCHIFKLPPQLSSNK